MSLIIIIGNKRELYFAGDKRISSIYVYKNYKNKPVDHKDSCRKVYRMNSETLIGYAGIHDMTQQFVNPIIVNDKVNNEYVNYKGIEVKSLIENRDRDFKEFLERGEQKLELATCICAVGIISNGTVECTIYGYPLKNNVSECHLFEKEEYEYLTFGSIDNKFIRECIGEYFRKEKDINKMFEEVFKKASAREETISEIFDVVHISL